MAKDTKQRILAATLDMFAARGYAVTTVLAALLAGTLVASSSAPAFAAQDVSRQELLEGKGDTAVEMMLGNDLLWAGESDFKSDIAVANDVLAAGYRFDLRDATVGGSVRAAGQAVVVDNVAVGQSVTLAGQRVNMRYGSSKTAALAGQEVAFSGETDSLYAAGETVYLAGTVHGDVRVEAKRLVIYKDTVVEGALHASVVTLRVEDGAQVPQTDVEYVDSSFFEVAAFPGSFSWLFALVGMAIVFCTALLAEWLARRQTVQSAAMVKARTAPMLVSGLVGALVAPLALVLLMLTLVGIPASIALGCLLVALQLVACGFAAASLAKVAFPRMGRFRGAMAMGAIVGVVAAVPVIGWLVDVAAFMYGLGYVLQRIYLGMRLGYDPMAPAAPADESNNAAPGEA